MTKREFKVGDRVRIVGNKAKHSFNLGDIVKISRKGMSYDWICTPSTGKPCVFDADITHADPVPIGYTGKLKDMDLQEGDVVRHTKDDNGQYTLDNGYVGAITIENSNDNYTLISRVSQSNEWTHWHQSRKDGTYDAEPNREYETHALPDVEQVMYRSRDLPKKESVVTWEIRTVSVRCIDGVPQYDEIAWRI